MPVFIVFAGIPSQEQFLEFADEEARTKCTSKPDFERGVPVGIERSDRNQETSGSFAGTEQQNSRTYGGKVT